MPACAARRTVLQKVRGCALQHFHSLWARGFRFSFTPLPGSFSPFPHGTVLYRSLWVFSLGGWSPLFPARFHVSYSTLVPSRPLSLTRTGLSPSLAGFPKTFLLRNIGTFDGPQPRDARHHGLGSSLFARRYLGNRSFFLFLPVLRCFSSRGSLYIAMYSLCSDWSLSRQVSPFRNPRINRYLLLPVAYRSLSRLSSAPSAKASTLRSY